MKSNTKKRLIAFMLCMVLVLSSATSAFADDNVDGLNAKTGCQAMTLTQEMKNVDDQTIGTVYADIPENAFYLDDPSDEITMDLAKVENEESILDAIQSNLKEHEALTDAVMCKVDFKVNGVSAEPNTAIALRFENLNMNLENATAFSHDTSLKIIDKTVVSAGEEQALQISADKNQIYGFYTTETVSEEENVAEPVALNDDAATVATGDSTCTIAATKQLQVHVTYRVSGTNEKLFASKTYTLKQGGTLNLAAQKSDNYTVASVYRADETGNKTGNALSLRQDGKIAESLSENTNYCVFYQATTDNDFRGNVTFYDYQINPPAGQKSINDPSYYGKADNNRRFAMGNSGYRKSGEKYSVYKNYIAGQDDVDINEYNEKRQFYIYKDIITGVNVSTGALVMGTNKDGNQIVEPGLFTTENAGEGSGKQYYTDFNLKFNRTGNEYRLSAVERSGQTVVSDMSYFFPLDAYKGKEKDGGEAFSDTNHNYYFGMRYDIQFKLKDYIGALTYSFTGDDDLWVVMDGNRVVVDVGGIHDKMDGKVDLWTVFLGKEKYTDAEKEAYVAEHGSDPHQLTVLYLERGAYKSNCNMTYVLPNSSIVNPGEIQNTSLTFTKTDAETGKGLEGAEFGVYEDEALTTSLRTIRSDENGTVTLSNLSYGEVYYLKETKAPSGYVAGNTVYKVVVESPGGTTTAKMFAVGDKDETAVTAVPNAKANWEQSKTAQLVDWNARTYDITLSASSLVKTAETTERPVDVSLVIDTSGSMRWDADYQLIGTKQVSELDTSKTYYYLKNDKWYELVYSSNNGRWYTGRAEFSEATSKVKDTSTYTVYQKKNGEKTRIQAVKDAAIAFVNNLRTTSPNSRVSVTGFSDSVTPDTELLCVGEGSDYNQIISAINRLGSKGGTYQHLGLNAAKRKLDASPTADKYVVLLADGASSSATNAEESAKAVKNAGIKLMTIGVGLTETTQKWLATLSSGEGYSFNASSTQEINQAFAFVSQTIEDTLPISGAVVRDYIDPRFELVTPEADIAAMGGEIKTDENGQTYIEWNNAVIGKKGTDGTPGWRKIIRVKAKDAYIGGNDVVTNGPESGITVGIDDRKFNQPTVNVKVDFNVNNGEKTIFKGDKPGDYIDEAKLNEVTKLKSTTGTEYTMLDDVTITTKWFKDAGCTEEISKTDILNTALTEETVYYAKVTVTPKSAGTASAANSIGDNNGNCTRDGKKYYAVDSNGVTKKDGTYTIKLVSGAINITKKLENATNTDKEFNFTITRTDVTPNQEIATVKVTVAASQTTGALAGDELKKVSNLARGTYVVTENATSGYDVKGILKGVNTNCQIASTTDDSITFVMGNDMDGKDVIGMDKVGNITESTYNKPAGILGVVEYTNEEVTNGWGIKKVSASSDNPYIYLEGAKFKLTSTTDSSVAYYGKSNKDGLLIWYDDETCADTKQVSTLPKGTYTMEEKTAPAGYKCSTEKWQIQIMKNGALKSIASSVNGTPIKTVTKEVNGKNVIYYLYQNEAVYALPSTGGTGIYLYMIGGMLLMFAAVWILYKNKCKEVLEK
ncbi:SpaA isopeptide-forming pilin-related protein [Coprococcus comes]|uniref:SpaA isopeptide-forming pilin-related protein n=1 Tax=Coprococcus comes TaxID=410072 RepID=UPI00319EA56F